MAGIAAIGAFLTYLSNSRRERAKWAVQLFDKFFEEERYKQVRDTLDCPPDAIQVQEMVDKESSEFTDYLNFFELTTILAKTKQISRKDLLRLFQYYLRCLQKHSAVLKYVNAKEKGKRIRAAQQFSEDGF
jgi:hypothetical protein